MTRRSVLRGNSPRNLHSSKVTLNCSAFCILKFSEVIPASQREKRGFREEGKMNVYFNGAIKHKHFRKESGNTNNSNEHIEIVSRWLIWLWWWKIKEPYSLCSKTSLASYYTSYSWWIPVVSSAQAREEYEGYNNVLLTFSSSLTRWGTSLQVHLKGWLSLTWIV